MMKVKKILRSMWLKTIVFLLCVLSVGLGAGMISNQLYQIVMKSQNIGMIYNFENNFDNSNVLRRQLQDALNTVDWLIADSSDTLIQNNQVNTDLLYGCLARGYVGNVSFRHNGIEYNGGAEMRNDGDTQNYYMRIAPNGDVSCSDTVWVNRRGLNMLSVYDNSASVYPGEYNPASTMTAPSPEEPKENYALNDYILVSITQEQAQQLFIQWSDERFAVQKCLMIGVAVALFFLFALIYLLWVAGRVPADDDLHMLLIDRMPIEITGLLACLVLGGGVLLGALLINVIVEDLFAGLQWLIIVCGAICSGFLIIFAMSLVRNFKNRTFVSRSLTLRVCRWCWRKTKQFLSWCIDILKSILGISKKKETNSKERIFPRMKRAWRNVCDVMAHNYRTRNAVLLFIGYSLIMMFLTVMVFATDGFASILCVLWLVFGCVYLYKRMNGFQIIVKGIQNLRAGKFNEKLTGLPTGIFSLMADDMNSLGEGMQNALQNAIRAERMKSELITNVSHDLKTPLTSILNYSDLLCQEQLAPEEANDYAKIIHEKSIRLKNLTSDLFDISKVQSGVERIDCERLDANTLVRQALAELEQSISESGLIIKTNLPDHELFIWADGKKMSRVLENLLGNCMKYAMPKTRVYITVTEENDTVEMELKNIAGYEMNFKAEEIIERFMRGDSSRSTEGSGLGLAIAKSYVEACGGVFNVTIDGDLFKVNILFPAFHSRVI